MSENFQSLESFSKLFQYIFPFYSQESIGGTIYGTTDKQFTPICDFNYQVIPIC